MIVIFIFLFPYKIMVFTYLARNTICIGFFKGLSVKRI
jgi:hypothetical protein